jgi:hypothetical protein
VRFKTIPTPCHRIIAPIEHAFTPLCTPPGPPLRVRGFKFDSNSNSPGCQEPILTHLQILTLTLSASTTTGHHWHAYFLGTFFKFSVTFPLHPTASLPSFVQNKLKCKPDPLTGRLASSWQVPFFWRRPARCNSESQQPHLSLNDTTQAHAQTTIHAAPARGNWQHRRAEPSTPTMIRSGGCSRPGPACGRLPDRGRCRGQPGHSALGKM